MYGTISRNEGHSLNQRSGSDYAIGWILREIRAERDCLRADLRGHRKHDKSGFDFGKKCPQAGVQMNSSLPGKAGNFKQGHI